MPCKHYDCGRCLSPAREVTRTKWIGFLAVQRQEVGCASCEYSHEVWVGNLCFPGQVDRASVGQGDCALYEPIEPGAMMPCSLEVQAVSPSGCSGNAKHLR